MLVVAPPPAATAWLQDFGLLDPCTAGTFADNGCDIGDPGSTLFELSTTRLAAAAAAVTVFVISFPDVATTLVCMATGGIACAPVPVDIAAAAAASLKPPLSCPLLTSPCTNCFFQSKWWGAPAVGVVLGVDLADDDDDDDAPPLPPPAAME